jgi:hypothetical protein
MNSLSQHQAFFLPQFSPLTAKIKSLKNSVASIIGKIAQVNNAKKTQIKLITTHSVKKPFENIYRDKNIGSEMMRHMISVSTVDARPPRSPAIAPNFDCFFPETVFHPGNRPANPPEYVRTYPIPRSEVYSMLAYPTGD